MPRKAVPARPIAVAGRSSARDPEPAITRYASRQLTACCGIAWVAASLVILQFDHASVTTVGVLVGLMFVGAGVENLALARLDVPMRWTWSLFGGVFVLCGIVCFADPTSTFAGLGEMLGFLFLIVGVWWMMRAFVERAINPFWWVGLISGVLMTVLAFWSSGAFFIQRAYVLLVFAGIWALMQGITSIVRGLQLRAPRFWRR